MVPIRDAARWRGVGGLALREPATIFDISRTSAPVFCIGKYGTARPTCMTGHPNSCDKKPKGAATCVGDVGPSSEFTPQCARCRSPVKSTLFPLLYRQRCYAAHLS